MNYRKGKTSQEQIFYVHVSLSTKMRITDARVKEIKSAVIYKCYIEMSAWRHLSHVEYEARSG